MAQKCDALREREDSVGAVARGGSVCELSLVLTSPVVYKLEVNAQLGREG
jgi:hypothetical protein